MNLKSLKRLIVDIFFVAQRDRKWFFLPLIIVLLFLALFLIIGAIAGPLAPLIYPLF